MPKMVRISVRLSEAALARLRAAAQRRGTTQAAIVRAAIEAWLEEEEAEDTPYERVADLIGSVEGPGGLSENGRRVADMLKARRERGGSR